jgi:hypothetical protein
VTLPVVGEELALEARDVDADRTFGLARAAFETQIERVVHTAIAEAGFAERPAIVERSMLARPRVECCSSRVAMYDGHIVPSSVLRHAPRPLHISTAPAKPPTLEVEKVAGFGASSAAVTQVRRQRRASTILPGLNRPCGSNVRLIARNAS